MPFIPHVTMSTEKMAQCVGIMVQGNTLLRYWSDKLMGKRKRKVFRKMLLDGTFDLAAHGASVEDQAAFSRDRGLMLAVKEIEFELCQSFGRTMVKEAKRINKYDHQTILDQDDFEMEAYIATVDAIWGYNDPKVQLVTYVITSIRNRFSTKLTNANPLGGRASSMALAGEYARVQKEASGPMSWEEVVEKMGLDEEQQDILRSLQKRQINLSDIQDTTKVEPGDHLMCISQLGTPLFVGSDNAEARTEFMEIAQKANLTPFEWAIVVASGEDETGWRTRVAAENFNPNTGKPFTRAAVNSIMQRAYEKLAGAGRRAA